MLEGSRAGGHFNMPQGVRSLRWDSRRRRLRSKRQGLLGEETGRDPGAGGRHVGQWPMGGVNGPGRLGPEGSEPLAPRKRQAHLLGKTLTGQTAASDSHGASPALRVSGCPKSYPGPDMGAPPPSPPLPGGVQLHPKWPPIHLHPRSPGSGQRARNSIGTTSSHLESCRKSIP